jgi:hypothetical protein
VTESRGNGRNGYQEMERKAEERKANKKGLTEAKKPPVSTTHLLSLGVRCRLPPSPTLHFC